MLERIEDRIGRLALNRLWLGMGLRRSNVNFNRITRKINRIDRQITRLQRLADQLEE